jgi:hypothetical protein
MAAIESIRYAALLLVCGSFLGCSSDEPQDDGSSGTGGSSGSAGSGGSSGSSGTGGSAGEIWTPGKVFGTPRAAGPRGLIDRRGLIHAHSVNSHDACDGNPRDATGKIDEVCFDDFRRGLCQSRHDFVMLTDHDTFFKDTEYPDTLLYRADRGDSLVERNGAPVASWAACADQDPALILAGCEAGTMPVGIEQHVAATPDARGAVYGASTPDAVATLKAAGAVSLVAHTEDWTPEQVIALGLDGFEMYNLHANFLRNTGAAIGLIGKISTPDQLPHSDLVLMPILQEDPTYLETWASVLSRGTRVVTTMGTDCHRNTLKNMLPDGERVDSYRRMMIWFSNHLLVRPQSDGKWDDRDLKQALSAGRLYGVFELYGYPVGFDFHAAEGSTVREMGEEASVAAGAELRVTSPSVQGLDPSAEPPLLRTRILRAEEGSWEVAGEAEGDLAVSPTAPGVYRAEVRITPRHLRAHLSSYAALADQEAVWIYANPIYVIE